MHGRQSGERMARRTMQFRPPLTIPAILSKALGLLVLACTLGGLFVPDLYRRINPILLPGSYGQDWMSLAALPVLAWAVRSAQRGSLRAIVIWLGLLSYYAYAYALYAFGPQHTMLYPLYVAITGLTAFALVTISIRLDSNAFCSRLQPHLRTRPIILLFTGIVVFLAPVWLLMMFAAIRQGTPSLFVAVHVLDLAFVFPLLIVAAAGLSRQRPWSYIVAGAMLVLAATMMGSLVMAEVIAFARFTPDPLPLASIFAGITLASSLLARSYLRDLQIDTNGPHRSPATAG